MDDDGDDDGDDGDDDGDDDDHAATTKGRRRTEERDQSLELQFE